MGSPQWALEGTWGGHSGGDDMGDTGDTVGGMWGTWGDTHRLTPDVMMTNWKCLKMGLLVMEASIQLGTHPPTPGVTLPLPPCKRN